MALESSLGMLKAAQAGRYAVPAFNVENMETLAGVLRVAEAEGSPVMLQTTPGSIQYAGIDMFAAMARAAAGQARVPVALHLDHGDSFERCRDAVNAGYTSVMIDGSKLPLEENIALTKKVVEMAFARDIPVEGELGTVGGKEDTHEVKEGEDVHTSPKEAEEFVRRTGVGSLAVAIGTAHGFYKGTPKLDFDRLVEIRAIVSVPIVLHGASGVPEDAVKRSIQLGCCKVNFATELRAAFTKGVRAALADEAVYDPKVYLGAGQKTLGELVREKIAMCGSAGKA